MSPPPSGPPLPLHKSFAASAIAACSAEVLTLPLDTAKVRLQIQPTSTSVKTTSSATTTAAANPKYRGLVSTVRVIAAEEGPTALWKGLVPSLHRQVLYGGLRIGLYDPLKRAIADASGGFLSRDGLGLKVASGLATGALAIAVASPTDLVKVRMQAEGKLPAGAPKRYPSALGAYATIVRTEGVAALWTGLGPNVARNAIINAAELASYDAIKERILSVPGVEDGVPVHVASGLGAGFFAVVCGSPVDVVKSRMMGELLLFFPFYPIEETRNHFRKKEKKKLIMKKRKAHARARETRTEGGIFVLLLLRGGRSYIIIIVVPLFFLLARKIELIYLNPRVFSCPAGSRNHIISHARQGWLSGGQKKYFILEEKQDSKKKS